VAISIYPIVHPRTIHFLYGKQLTCQPQNKLEKSTNH